MTTRMLLLGVDIGTSSTKAVVCDERGEVLATGSAAHPISRPQPGWSEQEPEDWWGSTVGAVRTALGGLDAERVGAVGLSGQMHGAVLLDQAAVDGDGRTTRALRPALLWNDQRTAEECGEIEAAAGGRRALVDWTGNAALTGFTLPKVLWVKKHEPRVFARAAKVVLPKDYVRLRMTGRLASDVGDASGVLGLDVERREWNRGWWEKVGLRAELWPEVVESATEAGRLTAWAAAELGLRAGIGVAAGSGDNMMGAIGAGIAEEGKVVATTGTSGVVYAHTTRPLRDLAGATVGRTHCMCAADGDARRKGGWCVTGCTLAAGGALQWFHDTLGAGVSYDELMREAGEVRPGCEGLCFVPHLTGERCPHADPQARGAFVGLTARHGRGHLVRAVLEGVTFTMGQILEIQRGLGVKAGVIRLGGGGAKSALWRQMQADVYGTPVALTNTEEGPALGAALIAGVTAGVWGSVAEACGAAIRETVVVEPQNREQYAAVREVFARLYGDLRERFAELGAV